MKGLATMPGDDGVDLGEAFFGEQGEVFLQGGEGKFESHVEGGLAEELTHEGVVVGDVVEAVIVAIERKADDAEDEDLPEIHAGATGGFFVGGLDAFEDGEHFAVHFGGGENPLEGGEDGRKFVARLGRDFDFFDGHGSKSELDVE